MKPPLLSIVQTILSSMDSDEVNSISDTTESMQVAEIVKTVYNDIAILGQLPRDQLPFQLQASGDATLPVTMYIPEGIDEILWLKYDYATADQPTTTYQPLRPMPFGEFINMVTTLNPTETDITTYQYPVGSSTFTLYCRNNIPPVYYTTADDNTILFDGFDNTVDTTLQSSKTFGLGHAVFQWQMTDTFVPQLDDTQFQRLLHESKSLAFAELKQSQHVKAEKSARDIRIIQQSSKYKLPIETAYDRTEIVGRNTRLGHMKPTGRYK